MSPAIYPRQHPYTHIPTSTTRTECVVLTKARRETKPLMLLGVVRGASLLLGLEVVQEDAALLGLLTPILDNDARAVDNLAGVALTVNLA